MPKLISRIGTEKASPRTESDKMFQWTTPVTKYFVKKVLAPEKISLASAKKVIPIFSQIAFGGHQPLGYVFYIWKLKFKPSFHRFPGINPPRLLDFLFFFQPPYYSNPRLLIIIIFPAPLPAPRFIFFRN